MFTLAIIFNITKEVAQQIVIATIVKHLGEKYLRSTEDVRLAVVTQRLEA